MLQWGLRCEAPEGPEGGVDGTMTIARLPGESWDQCFQSHFCLRFYLAYSNVLVPLELQFLPILKHPIWLSTLPSGRCGVWGSFRLTSWLRLSRWHLCDLETIQEALMAVYWDEPGPWVCFLVGKHQLEWHLQLCWSSQIRGYLFTVVKFRWTLGVNSFPYELSSRCSSQGQKHISGAN